MWRRVATILGTALAMSSQHKLAIVYMKSINSFLIYIDRAAQAAAQNSVLAGSQGTGTGFQVRQGSVEPACANAYISQSVRFGTGTYAP
ncbi:hypothetical protein SAMN07250955_105104 [Arboricoccus pini]|uniref:Uncharacterized protein n=1 Tax=Arboricoccus pini TaxID=1963835 RepID=A0A212R320_9PROT|nr:hypothetical protein [Arboricoccus pini]SNB66434.1 hypothetical protein SAMN07250955_105104 [Arboricoccus pini]